MASFQFTRSVPSQGMTFVFSSWVCVVDGADSFSQFLIDMKPKLPWWVLIATLTSSLTILMTCQFMDPLRGPRRSLLPARLLPALQQPSLGWTHSNLRIRVADQNSVCAIWPLIFRRPTSPSPSPHWRRTWTLCSNSESPKPPHIRGLWVVSVPMF
jgi:hypothetical protein